MIAGIERADSVTIDAHKWLATTMGCGIFITIRPEVLESAFNVSAKFMPSEIGCSDPYLTSVQWSRRFVGLRLFLALANAGWEGYAAHVEQSFARLAQLVEGLTAYGWTLANPDGLAVACLCPPPGSLAPRQIVENVLASGNAWVSSGMFEGKEVIRACITNGETSALDIIQVIDALEEARRSEAAASQISMSD